MNFLNEFTKRDFQVALITTLIVFVISHFVGKGVNKAL